MNITNSPSGKIVRALTGYDSFVPHPLPPVIEWDAALVNSLSRADHVMGMLAREGARLPNPHLLMRPFIVREAVLSSRIEGTQATLGDILAQDAGMAIDRSPADLQEVQNYIKALDYALARRAELPLSLRLIKEIHGILMQGVRGSHATPGEFRKSQNWIGVAGSTISSAKYIPPLPEELMTCLSDFESFLYNRTLPPLIHSALCHYQFEAIHPFLDGNGRVGRLLITLLFMEQKVLPAPLLYLSAFFEATRDQYYAHLFSVSSQGTWREWLLYFLNGVAVQGLDVLSRAERINALLESWQSMLVGKSSDSTVHDIIRHLAVNPYCTSTLVAERLGIAFTTAQRAIRRLEALGIVAPVSDTKRSRAYCAQSILAILEEPTSIGQNADGSLRT